MLVAAGLEDRSTAEIADAYEAAFHADEALVNILPAHVFPRATEHIPEMLALAEAAGGCGARVRVARRQRVLLGVVVPRVWAAVRATRSTTCAPVTAATWNRTSATRRTSPCGSAPARGGP